MDILYGFLSGVLKDVACGATNQLQYSFCFNSFVKELEKEEDNLIEMIRSVEDRVIHARRQTLKTTEVIDKWLENANIDSEYVNRLLRETNAKKSCFFEFCPNWIWRYRLGKKLAIKKADLQKIIQDGRQYIQLQRIASIPSNTFDILTEKSMNFDSRKFAFDQLMEAVKDDGVAMIGLYGMGGCGKTTLAMEVKKIAEVEHLFDRVIFVPVSSTVEVPRIQEKIASSLHYTFPENQEMERSQRLCMRLTQEKKILMILDDVWEKLDFGRIGISSSEYHKGCKILITTRSEDVCILMDCQKKIYLPILTDEEAWTLFQNKALMSKDTPENMQHLAISISKECKGLPVAIVAVASSLKGKKEAIWHSALNKLRSSKPINISRGLQDPYMCLKLSYDNLDTDEAKSLFLLCSVFPEDYEISVECLIRCAIGLGVAGEVDIYEEARTEVTAAKIKLVSSCLMLEAGDERVKMHDLVRDVAHWIAKNENKIIKCELEKDVSLEEGSIRYLWCVKFPDGMDCSNLEFLSIQTKLEVSDGIFERMGKLRVLIITNKNGYRLQLSTTSFKSLTNLRCLVLQYFALRDISFVRDLKKLQSLSFHRCSCSSFLDLQTDVAVTTLTNLKLLEFISCDIESNIFEEIKRIPFLEELYILENGQRYNNEENVKFFNSFSVPHTLQRFGIILGYDIWQLEFCSYERTLRINYFDISNEVIKGLAGKARELYVGNIEGGAKNMMPDIFEIEEGMNELKELRIRDCEEIVCLVDTSNHLSKMGNIFSKLRLMRIMSMNNLKTLWHGCLPANGCFEKLENMYIEDCHQLTCLFTNIIVPTNDKTKKSEDQFRNGHSMQSKIFQNLQEVRIYHCRELKHVFSTSISGDLSQLKMLEIKYCHMLEQIIEEVLPPPAHHEETNEIVEEDVQSSSGSFFLSSLALLKISSCSMLESLFTISVAKTLTSLEKLKISNCHGLKHIVPPARVKRNKNMVEDEHEFENDLSMFSNLKSIFIRECVSLQDIFATPVNECFEKLEKVYIDNCPQLTYLFTYVAQGLTELKILHIYNCDILKHIITYDDKTKKSEDQFTSRHSVQSRIFQNLEEVMLDECGELKHVFSANIIGGLPQLKKLEIENCNMLQQIIVEEDECQHFESNQVKVSPESISIPSVSTVNNISGSFSLSSLALLSIKYCLMLDSLFTTSVAKTLTSLEELDISNCDGLKHIVSPERVKRNKNMVEDEHEFESNLSMFSSLKWVKISRCDSLQDIFIMPFVGGTVNIQNHFSTQQTLRMSNANNGDWMMGQQVSLKLEFLKLSYLHEMTHIWVATNNSFTLQHLNSLIIEECEKLEVIFPQSMLRSLPELNYLQVSECKELRQIIEEDLEDKSLFAQPCFPKLDSLVIERCHKLKCFTSVIASNALSNLRILIIKEATELQEFIACEYDETVKTKVELPQLKLIIFMDLSNFQQESIFSNVKHRIIRNCPKLSLTSTITPQELQQNYPLEGLGMSETIRLEISSLMYEIKKLDEVSTNNNSTELPSSQINEKLDKNVTEKDYGSKEVAPATTASYFTDQQSPLGQTQSTIKMSQDWDPTPKNTSPLQMNREDQSTSQIKPFSSQVNDNNQSMLESRVEMVGQHNKIETKTQAPEIEEFQKIDRKNEMASDPQAMDQNFPVISSPNMTQRTDEIETDNLGKTTTSDKPAIPTFVSENIEEIGRERRRGGPAIEGVTIKTLPIGGDNISLVSGVTIHNSSGANILSQDSQIVKQDNELNEDKTEIAPHTNIKIQERVNLLDKTEGVRIVSNNDVVVTSASTDTRTRLEKYKQFVDLNDSQISLLVEAIEAYPHLWNACEKFTDRFRAWMLKTLVDMLLFLRSESVGSINPHREKEFLKLCDEAVQLGFERSWVDQMRQRVLGRDPKLDHAKVRINELLKRHDHLTWELDNIKKELRSLNDFLNAQAKCFDFL
ncbi:uncharacterized protein LOC106764739 isoform X2 [Vigna radiata var. radiata]|uniref:Uncharacterized protein LOC106764739 isoform X2 n=1 Tax=Vigna radiata var. radiata TaxID=3916 RepID=A0A1S3UEY1_VIGRR|nr:uncharacterized protein LOC106764739 isoform X2 [Vigna radiata var. radiata]